MVLDLDSIAFEDDTCSGQDLIQFLCNKDMTKRTFEILEDLQRCSLSLFSPI